MESASALLFRLLLGFVFTNQNQLLFSAWSGLVGRPQAADEAPRNTGKRLHSGRRRLQREVNHRAALKSRKESVWAAGFAPNWFQPFLKQDRFPLLIHICLFPFFFLAQIFQTWISAQLLTSRECAHLRAPRATVARGHPHPGGHHGQAGLGSAVHMPRGSLGVNTSGFQVWGTLCRLSRAILTAGPLGPSLTGSWTPTWARGSGV